MGLLGIGHIERHRTHAVPILLDEVAELLGMARRRDQTIAVLQGGLGETPPEAAGTADNQPDF